MSFGVMLHAVRYALVIGSLLAAMPAARAGPALASHPFSCGQADVRTIDSLAATIYVVHHDGLTAEHDPVAETFVYLESNGRAGVQTGGPSPILGEVHRDPCPMEDADLRLY